MSSRKISFTSFAIAIVSTCNKNFATLSFSPSFSRRTGRIGSPGSTWRTFVKADVCSYRRSSKKWMHGFLWWESSRRRRKQRDNKTKLQMALISMLVEELEDSLAVGVPTGEQYTTYWGRTSRERYEAMFEAASVTFLGLFASYFLSFAIGNTIATFLGTIAAFWVLLGPEAKAYQRNWELIGGRKLSDPLIDNDDYYLDDIDDYGDDSFERSRNNKSRGLFGAYFVSCVERVAVVDSSTAPESEEYDLDEFQDYTMETDEHELEFGTPYKLRLVLSDRSGRNMQVHGRMSEKYINIAEGMPCVNILLSADPNFRVLAALTDFYIPDANCFVGDYPYLNKFSIVKEIEENNELASVLDDEDRTEEFWGDAVDSYDEELPARKSSNKDRQRRQQPD